VVFWAVVSDEIKQVIEFFPTCRQAERMIAKALEDEPDWRGILHVEQIELERTRILGGRTVSRTCTTASSDDT
jgi:hypothetical protein